MDHEKPEPGVARRSARIYVPLALGAAIAFFVASGWTGNPDPVARVGGAFWVGLLTWIVSMPLVTARAKRKGRSKPPREPQTRGQVTEDGPCGSRNAI